MLPLNGSLKSYCVGKRDVGAEADHAESGGGALARAEAGAGFEFAFERGGEGDDKEVGGGVESDREDAERGELQENVAASGCDELRDEGKEEQRSFWVEGFGEDALTESAARRCRAFNGGVVLQGDVTRAEHFYAEEDEIGGTGVLDCVEGYGGGGENSGNAEGGGEDGRVRRRMCRSKTENLRGGLLRGCGRGQKMLWRMARAVRRRRRARSGGRRT